ncbi:hypothetical protein CIPAW_01G037900 [Carya illinoinensis]|uniref:MATH domain-containing protein n=1 Tax=Carya illinoinensis TaxID=32201 RepID=A0A8T1RL52_CARIL|nr:hypothetical protein CIPAW_01G037900 [Carya illinoinensis]
MEDKSCHSTSHADIDSNATRNLPPAHYTFQVKNFSIVKTIDKCESAQFEVGGYQWKLVLHPNQNRNGKDQNGHISLYLSIEDTDELSHGWEVNTYIKFFVFDQIRDKYLCIQDAHGSVRRFHKLKTEWGFAHLFSHDTLNDPSNGYLVGDTFFGVEVFVIKGTFMGECFSMINEPQINYFTWRIWKYSALKDEEKHYSDQFVVGVHKCCKYVGLYLTSFIYTLDIGDERYGSQITSLSLFLKFDGSDTLFSKRGVYAKFKRAEDKGSSGCWFSDRVTSGIRKFLSLGHFSSSLSKTYLVGDCLIVECKIDVVSTTKDFIVG